MDKELAFIGKITAGMTHEINNVLAVIKETSGLMQDIITYRKKELFSFLKKDDVSEEQEKFLDILSTIGNQVSRGIETMKRLNRFAHSMDEPVAAVDVGEILEQMAFLNQRFAQPKKVKLTSRGSAKGLVVTTEPLRLQLVISACIEHVLGEAEVGGQISLGAEKAERGVAIQVLNQNSGAAAPEGKVAENGLPADMAHLREILEILGARLSYAGDPGQRGLIINIPAKKE